MHLIVVMTAYFMRICCVMIMRPEVPGTVRYPVRRTRALCPVDLTANLTENEDRSRTSEISSECDF